jgi:hypothetical protein
MILTIYVLIEGVWQKRRNTHSATKFLLKTQKHLREGVEIGFYSEAKIVDERGREVWHFYRY